MNPGEMDEKSKRKGPHTSIFEVYKQESTLSGQPKGRPKSGRVWKTEQIQRFSDLKKDKPLRSSWKQKMEEKARKKSIKAYEMELRSQRDQDAQKRKEKREAKQKRRLENQRKAEVVQVIKNTAKLKRMKKKQLRQIETR